MDPLTHALSGALLARAGAPAQGRPGTPDLRWRMGAGFAAGAFPDIDFALRAVDTLWYLSDVHQGPTHSLVLLPCWALLVAWGCGRLSGSSWSEYFVPACLGLSIHVAGDLITAYGTMVFFPFSDWRPALSLVYVVDPWFTGIIVAALLAAWRWPRYGRRLAVLGLLLLPVHVGFSALQQQQALALGHGRAGDEGLGGAAVTALPQPFSAGHWLVILEHDLVYQAALVRVLPGRSLVEALPALPLLPDMASRYRATPEWRKYSRFGLDPAAISLALAAWDQAEFAAFRRFARFPALSGVTARGEQTCVWFMDLRFVLPALPPSFVFGMCRAPGEGSWQRVRRRGALWLD